MIGGDFNFINSPTLDRSRVSASCIAGLIEWSEIAESLNLFDVFRNFHHKTQSFTYRCASAYTQLRIDRVYASHPTIPYAKACKYIPLAGIISDHQAGVELAMRAIHAGTRGPSFWKLNSSLLERPGFQKLISKTISKFVDIDGIMWAGKLPLTTRIALLLSTRCRRAAKHAAPLIRMTPSSSALKGRLRQKPGAEKGMAARNAHPLSCFIS
jgi:hypothetical protein